MSSFSAVDDAPDPERLVAILDRSAVGLAAMKHYMATAHSLRRPSAPVLDVGCGAGHDLLLLAASGVRVVGVDPSSVMLTTARTRAAGPLVRGAGERLPFADGAFAGCRMERVLMHVAEPSAVLGEVVRCLQPGGLVTVFEPDWSSLRIDGAPPSSAAWLSNARHPAVGRQLGDLLARAGCSVVDRVEERSWWTFDEFERNINLPRSIERVVAAGRITATEAARWTAEQRERAAAGAFRAEMVKVLWVATKAS